MKINKAKTSIIILLIVLMLLLASCYMRPRANVTPQMTVQTTPILTSVPEPTPSPTPTIEPTAVPTPTPRSGPMVIGIYKSGSGGRVLLSEYQSKWTRGEDIATFNAYASNEAVLNYASFRDMMVDCWFASPNAKDYKIGYQLSYTLSTGEEISVIIKIPSDITHTQYLEVYLYDSVQQYAHGGWYTHLEDDDMDDETLLYSFKLTPGVNIEEVESIKLKAFVYKYSDDSDFDTETSEYIGTVSYEIDIIRVD